MTPTDDVRYRVILVFRQGDTGKCWYAVITGTLEVKITQPESETKVPVTLCSLGVGATFGESILQDLPRDTTVITQTTCELLRVEQQDFRLIWEKNKELMNDLVSSCKLKNGFGPGINPKPQMQQSSPTRRRSISPVHPNPAEPITETPSAAMSRVGWCLRTLLLCENTCLKDRKVSGKLVRRCAPGTELVDWLLQQSPGIHTRVQAAGMWQALLEEGIISHVNKEQPFKDKCFLYRFWQDEEGATNLPTVEDINTAEEQAREAVATLIQRGPDAMLRMILRKQSHERTADDLETIYEELLHIRALSHLSNSVKRELASVIVFEAHPKAGSVLFHQGDEGRSWYIILRGSVDVVIHGKGTVTTLQEGDDFGKLALINNAPR
ncbi:rap guanine nucleotide exchange factor 4-like isoform X2 [Agrilus planipennis]|uniref:Rap guanine nucleotide exchange factor 4-like isoform X2 n=1 Tax=Agrilus planipennis TaxID=224129 RepID=A0A1W4XTZ7_AGRPL|nr:rap guanine nucleotide exchange factor 4-like isoform X2 [Agrilus planipennis]